MPIDKSCAAEIKECLDIIEMNVNKIQYALHNGGVEDVDTEVVEDWQRKVLTEKLERLRLVSSTSNSQ